MRKSPCDCLQIGHARNVVVRRCREIWRLWPRCIDSVMSAEALHRRDRSKGRATMREKLVQKHTAADEHERNFSSGRVNIHERYLHRTGIRGRKIWIFCAILFFLGMIALINLLMLGIMFITLELSKDGMASLSFFESGTLRWMQPSDLEVVTSYTGQVNAFHGHNLDIHSEREEIVIHGGKSNVGAQVHVGDGETTILAEKGFRFVDPYIKKTVIHFDGSKMQLLPHQISSKKMLFNMMETHRVVTDEDQNLTLSTSQMAQIRGNEGVYLDSRGISLSGDQSVDISAQKEIVLDAKGGIHFGKLHESTAGNVDQSIQKYKLCICINSGQLYRVPVISSVTTCRTVEKTC